MTCEEIKPLFADYWNGTLRREENAAVQRHLEGCESCRAETGRMEILWRDLARLPTAEPGPGVRERFYETLSAYGDGARSAKQTVRWDPLLRIAAGVALLLAGAAAGYNLRSNQASANEITQLRGEVSTMRQLVTLSLLEQQSASERLRGVSWAVRAEPSDTQVLDALVKAVNHDSNVNVRLAAVDALRPFAANRSARSAVVDALPAQTEPIVQVALIDLLVDLNEQDAAQELRRLVMNESADTGVRQRAQWALVKLNGTESVQ